MKKRLYNLLAFKNYKIGIYLHDGSQENDGNLVVEPGLVASNLCIKVGNVNAGGKPIAYLKNFKPYSTTKFSVFYFFVIPIA